MKKRRHQKSNSWSQFWAFGGEQIGSGGASVVPDYNRKLFTN